MPVDKVARIAANFIASLLSKRETDKAGKCRIFTFARRPVRGTQMIKPRCNHSFSQFARPVFLVLLLFLSLVDEARSATPLLRCQLSQSDDQQTVDFVLVSNPYTVKAVDINGRFRFKAVFVGTEQFINYITLNVYYRAKRQWVLLHQAKYLPPFNQVVFPSGSLTGANYVYSPVLGRELQYSCSLLGIAP